MSKRKRKIAVIDCESDPFARGEFPEPFIFGFYDGETYEEFDSADALLEYLSDKDLLIYAHNGGKFDYFFMLEHLEPFSEVMIINGRLARFYIGQCEFRDSYNIIPVPMSAYKKDKFDYRILHKSRRNLPGNMDKIKRYLYSDCFNQYELVSKFIDRFGLHLTQAGASMKTWSKMTGLKPPRSTPEFYEHFSRYYYGGRVECFQTGDIELNFSVVDINSAYPRAMLNEHPFGFDYSYYSGTMAELLHEHTREEIGPSFFTVTAYSRGCFPYRAPDLSLTFPNDYALREYHITGWELLAGLDTGTAQVVEIRAGYIFTELVSFADYILHFYNERKIAKEAGDKAGDLFAKLLMNSLYGKWAADPSAYGNHVITPHEYGQLYMSGFNHKELSAEDRSVFAALAGYKPNGEIGPWSIFKAPLEEEEMRYYNVATSASITGYVRAYLWRNICKCTGLIYCDTDSIAAEDIGGIQISNELGDWSLDGEFDRAAVSGKKMYAFRYVKGKEPKDDDGKPIRWKTASKGVRLAARQLIQVARGKEVLYMPESPTYSVHSGPHFSPRRVRSTAKSVPKII